MRCPKCGFISFDNVETCLRCNKDISQTARAFQGSTLNVATPVFLKFADLEDSDDFSLDNDGTEDEIEFADPDLEILVDQDEEESGAELDFAFGDDQEDETATTMALNEEFGGTAAGDEKDEKSAEGTLDLGMFEETPDEDAFAFEEEPAATEEPALNMELPEELADISDLSPPDKTKAADSMAAFSEEPEPAPAAFDPQPEEELAAEPADDLDFSSMDMDFDLGTEAEADQDEISPAAEKTTRPGSRMDDDLNFDLDLGGLSIHDDK